MNNQQNKSARSMVLTAKLAVHFTAA